MLSTLSSKATEIQRFRDSEMSASDFIYAILQQHRKIIIFPTLPLTRGQENMGAHPPVPAAPVEAPRVQRAVPPAATLMTEHHGEAPR